MPNEPRKPTKVVKHPCKGGCGRDFYLEGYTTSHWVTVNRGLPDESQIEQITQPHLAIEMRGHIEPAPQGCMMVMDRNWMLFWVDRPYEEKIPDPSELKMQMGDAAQNFGPFALCSACLTLGGKRLIPHFLKGLATGSMSIKVTHLMEILKMVTNEAHEYHRIIKSKIKAPEKGG